jgi:hypothetical protein
VAAYICIMEQSMDYNTQRESLIIPEYGRHVQEMVQSVCKVKDRITRSELAHSIIDVMLSLNPQMKELGDTEQKLWDHLYIISEFKLDVDSPYEPPSRESVNNAPAKIPYRDQRIKFRFYGRNLQTMVEQINDIKDPEIRGSFIDYIASFMVNSSRNWNDENLDNETVITHLNTLAKGDLSVTAEDLNIHIEHRAKKRPTRNNQNRGASNHNRKKKKRK